MSANCGNCFSPAGGEASGPWGEPTSPASPIEAPNAEAPPTFRKSRRPNLCSTMMVSSSIEVAVVLSDYPQGEGPMAVAPQPASDARRNQEKREWLKWQTRRLQSIG